MSKFPSNTTMIVSLLILAVLSGMKYSSKLDKSQLQLKFDWNKAKEVQQWRHIRIDSLDYNYLLISSFTGQNLPDNQNTLELISDKGEKYYFRFIDVSQKRDTVVLGAVEWLTGVPELKNGNADLLEYDIPIKQNTGKSVVTIGDEMLIKDEAKYFRRKIAAESNVNFEGRRKDVFNYPHEADYRRSLEDVLDQVAHIPEADAYIIMLRPDALVNLPGVKQLIDVLSKRSQTQKIIWIVFPFLQDTPKQHDRQPIQDYLAGIHNDKLVILNGYMKLKDAPELYYLPDSISLSKEGYEKLAKETIKLLQ